MRKHRTLDPKMARSIIAKISYYGEFPETGCHADVCVICDLKRGCKDRYHYKWLRGCGWGLRWEND